MYSFRGLHVPGLTYITYVIVMVLARTAGKSFRKGRKCQAKSWCPQVLTPEKGEGAVVCGIRNVSSDSSVQPQASPCPRKRRKSGFTVPGTLGSPNPWKIWQVHFWLGKQWFTKHRILIQLWAQNTAPNSTIHLPQAQDNLLCLFFLSDFLNLAKFKKFALRELIFT